MALPEAAHKEAEHFFKEIMTLAKPTQQDSFGR
jgi:hypothetical protein